MSEEEKRELLKRLKDEELDKTASFSDIMSRSERRKRESEKINDIKQDLKLEKINNEHKEYKKIKKTKKPIENEKPIEKVKVIKKENKYNGLNVFVGLILTLTLGCGIFYVIYNYLNGENLIENLLTIINGGIITLIIFLFMITVLVKKDLSRKLLALFISILFIGLLGFNFLVQDGKIKLPTLKLVPNFINTSINEVLNWAEDNNLKINQTYEYSDNVIEFNVISQSVAPNSELKDIDSVDVIISNGPNYDKEVIIANMIGWNIDEAVKVIKDNNLNNVKVTFVKDKETKDTIIGQSINGAIKRNSELILTVSLGNNKLPDVTMIDLTNMDKFNALLWLNRNGIKNKIVNQFSNEVKNSYVISQDKVVDTNIVPGKDLVTVMVSKGKEIVVPDLENMSVEEVTNWVIANKLKITFKDKYDNDHALGDIINANYKIGSKISEGTKIIITTSKGKLKMEEFTTFRDFKNWADSLNIKYEEEEQYSDNVKKGDIISIDPKTNEYIDLNKVVKVVYSKGGSILIPNFYNKSKSYITSQCNQIGLYCTFSYGDFNNNISKDYAVSQQFKSGSKVPNGTSMYITLSKGKAKVYKGIVIQEGWLILGDANGSISSLKSKLKSACPGVTFNITKKTHSITKGLIHPDSPIKGGTSYSFTQGKTYTIYVVG